MRFYFLFKLGKFNFSNPNVWNPLKRAFTKWKVFKDGYKNIKDRLGP